MAVSGMPKKSANCATSCGKVSPGTIDFGFLNFLIHASGVFVAAAVVGVSWGWRFC